MENSLLNLLLFRLLPAIEIMPMNHFNSNDKRVEDWVEGKGSPPYRHPGHALDIPEFCFGLEGSFILNLKRRPIEVKEDNFMMVLPGEFHQEASNYAGEPYKVLWCHFIAPRVSLHIGSYERVKGYTITDGIQLFPTQEIFRCLDTIIAEMHEKGFGWEKVVRSQLACVVMQLARAVREYSHINPDGDPFSEWAESVVLQVKDFILANYNSPIGIKDVAAVAHLSPNYLSSLFKKVIGMGFNQYLTNIRLEKAKQLLTSTHMTVEDVALQVGYNSQPYFTRVFKKVVGETPSSFRNAARTHQ